MSPGEDTVKVHGFPSLSKSFLKLANFTLVNNCFNRVKGLEKLGHMVLHRDAVYIDAAAEYNLYIHRLMKKYTNAAELLNLFQQRHFI